MVAAVPARTELPTTVADPDGPLPVVWVRVDDMAQKAGLLVWGNADDGTWWAGVSWPDVRTLTLVTGWHPAAEVRRHPGETYQQVPRVALLGSPWGWPALPIWHPRGWPWTGQLVEHHVALP